MQHRACRVCVVSQASDAVWWDCIISRAEEFYIGCECQKARSRVAKNKYDCRLEDPGMFGLTLEIIFYNWNALLNCLQSVSPPLPLTHVLVSSLTTDI